MMQLFQFVEPESSTSGGELYTSEHMAKNKTSPSFLK